MTSKKANHNSSSKEEKIHNTLDQNYKSIIGISDDLNKLKTEVLALKIFVTEQLYLFEQSVGGIKTPKYNTTIDFCIKYLIEQIDYLKEENKKIYYPVFTISKSI